MEFGRVFWIFIVIIALQPMVSRWITECWRTKKLSDIEAMRSSGVILLMHRQTTMSLLAFWTCNWRGFKRPHKQIETKE